MKYIVNKIPFKTQKQVQDYAKEIMYRNDVGECLKGDDFDFMLDYFAVFHHEWDIKKGSGVECIEVIIDALYSKYRAFWIHRTDGSDTDISYNISKIKKRNYKTDLRSALRNVIHPQIKEFKQKSFEDSTYLICPYTNELMTKYDCHIDHYKPTFEEIINQFLIDKGIKDVSKLIAPSKDNQMEVELTDYALADEFYEYHKRKANLRVLSRLGNLSHAKQEIKKC